MRLSSWLTPLAFLLLPFMAMTAFAQTGGKSIIVLDASGSMWGQIDGRPKLDIAREALAEVVTNLPANAEMGLMAYGHRSKGECSDIELIVPPGLGTGPAITEAAANLKFLGKTPLTDAVRQAAAALRSTEDKATVILITDGVETCAADPCALGAELEASGVDFTAHVVGFGMTAEEGQTVACLAQETGGQYITADDLDSLTVALETTVVSAAPPEPVVVVEPAPAPAAAVLEVNFAPTALIAPGVAKPDDKSDVAWEILMLNADGSLGDRLTTHYNDVKTFVEPGTYRLLGRLDQSTAQMDITFTADILQAPELVFNAARVMLHPRGSKGGPVNDGAALRFTNAADMDTTSYGETRLYLPAGEVTLVAKLGEASVTETLSLTAGQLLDRDVIIGSGVAAVEAFYVAGVKMEGNAHSVEILPAKKALDGSRKTITTAYGEGLTFDLPPGDYVALARMDAASAETPFAVKTGERVEVSVILNAGVIGVTAPGATSIEIQEAKADLNGNRTSLAFHYTEETNLTAPPGDYLIIASRDGVMVEQTVTVVAGERVEAALTFP